MTKLDARYSRQTLKAVFIFSILLVAPWLIQPARAAEIRCGHLLLRAEADAAGVTVRISDEAGVEYANAPVLYEFELPGGRRIALVARLATGDENGLTINAQSEGIEVEHRIERRSTGDGFEERISVLNHSREAIDVADYRIALRRGERARGELRAVAVPFRRQADGKLRDWTVAEIASGNASNSDWGNEGAVQAPEVIDSKRGRLRSEAWMLTNGQRGLLVAKYNQEHIEYSTLAWQAGAQPGLLLGGSSFALYREPEPMQRLEPGRRVGLGTTYYLQVEGNWPAGYQRFRRLLADLGHGLPASYDPPINWNELFDVGWYHSDPAGLAKNYTREALLREAAKAAEIGATALYLDPGWEICEGTTRWADDRLGTPADLVRTLRENYGLGLAFRTIGRVYRDEFPHEWYMQRVPGQAYARPSNDRPATPEPVPSTDERGCRNLALLPTAVARASSCLPGYAIHRVEHLNDGWYNNAASWVSDGEPSWVEIDLGEACTIDRIRLGSEHTPRYHDRAPVHVRILAGTSDADGWQLLAENQTEPIRATRTFSFPPQKAKRVRIEILTSVGSNARIDEVEIYEAQAQPWTVKPRVRQLEPAATHPAVNPINFWEVCTQCKAWQAEKLDRIERITAAGMRFIMFDEFDWRGPCCAADHGHAVPSTPEGHVRAVYGLVREIKRRVPGVLVEAHDPVWPWGVRYLPVYFDQTLDPARRPGSYDENWGFEFMWNPIEDLISGRALCLYYYSLGCDIPLYDHITAENDNDACLAFWWYASTVRHLGIGGKKGLTGKQENETRWQAYKQAMVQYRRLREWFVRGEFVGIDELAHLHVLPGRSGGVLVAFNLQDKPIERSIVVNPAKMRLGQPPAVQGAILEPKGNEWTLRISIPPRSPKVIELGVQ